MRKRELYSLIRSVIAPIVAAAFTFWWLGKYSVICERDIVGTAITVWCAVLIHVLMWAE